MRTLLIPKQFSQGFSIAVKHLCIMVKCTQHSSNFCLQKNTHRRKPTICNAEIRNPSLMMAFIIFPASPEETHKRQYSILKSRIYNWKVFMPIYHLFSSQKSVCVML